MKRLLIALMLVTTGIWSVPAARGASRGMPSLPFGKVTKPVRVPVAVDSRIDQYLDIEVSYCQRQDVRTTSGVCHTYWYEVRLIPKFDRKTLFDALHDHYFEISYINESGHALTPPRRPNAFVNGNFYSFFNITYEFNYKFSHDASAFYDIHPKEAVALKITFLGSGDKDAELVWYDARGNYTGTTGAQPPSCEEEVDDVLDNETDSNSGYYIVDDRQYSAVALPLEADTVAVSAVANNSDRFAFTVNRVALRRKADADAAAAPLDQCQLVVNMSLTSEFPSMVNTCETGGHCDRCI